MDKVNDSITNNKALFCIGYHLPADIQIQGIFNKPVYFPHSKFQEIGFSYAKFSEADFSFAEFSGDTYFSSIFIKDKAYFNYVLFEEGKSLPFYNHQRLYFCKLHPNVKSVYLETIEHHMRYKDPQGHKAEVLRLLLIEQ